MIIKEFRHSSLEIQILQRGGIKLVLPAESRWCTQRDSCVSLLKNIHVLKQIAADPTVKKSKVTCILYNEEFIENVKEMIRLLDPICQLINKCQDKGTSIADSLEEWLILKQKMELYNDKVKVI